MCGQYQSQRPDEIRNHARACQNVPEPQRPSSRRSQRLAHRSAVAPYPPHSPLPPTQSSTRADIPSAQARGSSSQQQQQQQQQAETPSTEDSGSGSQQQQQAETPSAEDSGSSTTLHEHPIQPAAEEEAASYDGDGELSSQTSFYSANEEQIVPTPPPQAPTLTEEAQAEVARIRELLVQAIISNYGTVENLPEQGLYLRFNVRVPGVNIPALRAMLEVNQHGNDVDRLARMIYYITDDVPGGVIHNLRIHRHLSPCIIS